MSYDTSKDPDRNLLWIVREALRSPVHPEWSLFMDLGSGRQYYFNKRTKSSSWEKPVHEYKALAAVAKTREKNLVRTTSLHPKIAFPIPR